MSSTDLTDRLPPARLRRLLPLLAAIPIAVAIMFWLGLGPFRAGGRAAIQAELTRFDSKNSMISSVRSSSGNHCRFGDRRLLVLTEPGNPLLSAVAVVLTESLQKLPGIESIEGAPLGAHRDRSQRGPDAVLTVRLEKLAESGLARRDLDARVVVTVGMSAAADNHSTIDQLTPPMLEFFWRGQLDHHSTTIGVQAVSVRYRQPAADIANEFVKALGKQFAEWRAKYGELPELPSAFYPTFREPPPLPLGGYQPRLLFADAGFMKHCEALWECHTDKPLAETFADLRERFDAAIWNGEPASTLDQPRLYLKNDRGQLSMFPIDAGNLKPAAPPKVFYVRYVERMSVEERSRAIDELLTDGASIDTLLLFDHALHDEQRQRLLSRFDERPPTNSAAWLSLGNMLHAAKQDDRALEALSKSAAMLLAAQGDQAELQGRINAAAKELGHEKLADEPPEMDTLKQLGFVEVTKGTELPEIEFGADGMAAYVARTAEGKLHAIVLRPVKDRAVPSDYRLSRVESFPNGRSWTAGEPINEQFAPTYPFRIPGLGQLEVQVTKIKGEDRFRARVRLRDETPMPGETSGR